VPAASVPPQTNLVAYDIACTSIPSVVPTTANPGGLARRQVSTPAQGAQGAQGASTGAGSDTVGTHANPINAVPAGSPSPIAEPVVDDLSACLAACKGNPACIAYTFQSGVCKLFGPATTRRQAVGTHANPINSVPAGSPAPIAEPVVDNLAACLAACRGNQACVAYTFESGVCKLFGPTVRRRQQQGAAPGSTSGQAAKNPATSPATGSSTTTTQGTHANPINAVPAGSPTPIAEPVVDNLAACLAACRGNQACIAYTFESGVCKLFGPTVGRRQQQGAAPGSTSGQAAKNPATGPATGSSTTTKPTTTTQGTHANPINAVPAGSPAPIATPAVDDLTACLDACRGNPACIAYVFESGVCKLYD
jgi:hypothetical protein